MRGEIWLAVDKNKDVVYEKGIQGGTRPCVIVSNNTGNKHAPVVEIVYTTTRQKNNLPTHFPVTSTPEPSTVLCEQIMTVSKKDLTTYYGSLDMKEKEQLNECLKISLGL